MDGYKVLVTYNFLMHRELEYRRFMIQQWIPAMQALGLEPGEVLHTLWGDYPARRLVLYARDYETLVNAVRGEEWQHWRQQMRGYVRDLRYRIVPARPWLQF